MRFTRRTAGAVLASLTLGLTAWAATKSGLIGLFGVVFGFALYRLGAVHEHEDAQALLKMRVEIADLIASGNELFNRLARVQGRMVDGEETQCSAWMKEAKAWVLENTPTEFATFETPPNRMGLSFAIDVRRNAMVCTIHNRIHRLVEISARLPR